MIRASSKPRRSAGFTLLELMVGLAILGILAAIVAPPWARYRARMRAYSAAHELRAELTYIQSRSIDLEEECWLNLDSAGRYSVYVTDTSTGAGQLYKQINISQDGLSLSPATGKLVFAQKGWVSKAKTTLTMAKIGGFDLWTITVSAPGVVDVPVRIYLNGKVEVR